MAVLDSTTDDGSNLEFFRFRVNGEDFERISRRKHFPFDKMSTKGDDKDESALKTALMQTQLRMVEMGRKHRMEIRDLQRRNHELTERLLRDKQEIQILRTNSDYVTCSEEILPIHFENNSTDWWKITRAYVSTHETLEKQIMRFREGNERLSRVTSTGHQQSRSCSSISRLA